MINKGKFTVIKKPTKDRGFLCPNYKPSVRRFIIIIAGLYLKIVEGISKVDTFYKEQSLEAMKKFYLGEERLIFVFRHVGKEDPPLLLYFFLKILRREIKKIGGESHISVLYGRDVPNWAGKITEWLFPRIGAIPVQAHSNNKKALTIIRNEIKNGRFPIALAPEEQVVYHMYQSFSIAKGISSLARWGLETGKPVRIVPLAIGYKYSKNPEIFIREKLKEWEEQTGIKLENYDSKDLHPLLCRATQETLYILEPLCNIKPPISDNLQSPDQLDKRIKNLCVALLNEAEKTSETTTIKNDSNSIIDRLFKIRYSGYDAFYTKEDTSKFSPLNRSLAEFKALKAEVFIRYERIVDVLEYIHMSYIQPPFSAGRGCEFIMNLLDVINRAKGGNISEHSSPRGKSAVILSGTPLVYKCDDTKTLGRKDFLNTVKTEVENSLKVASAELEKLWETKQLK